MKLSDIQNLNAENIGTAPVTIKVVLIALVCVALLLLGYWKLTIPQLEEHKQATQKEVTLKESFETKQKKAANLEALRQQLLDIEESFGDMLKRLPREAEVAGLLVDISQQGLGAGLEFELFKPATAQPADFYSELPIQIRVIGNYHEFGEFISGVSDLPRIVTTHDVKIQGRDIAKGVLVMESTAKTYFLAEEEEEEQAPAKKQPAAKAKAKGRK
jgi:type IV pilus assembly protein PilO